MPAEMTVPSGKTPISFLQELCTKRGVTPQYDLLANEGAVHEPIFLMRVSVGEISATGKGSSKKKAKHSAAQQALNMILGITNGQVPGASEAKSSTGEECSDNPIGELQEFTQKRLIKPPIYTIDSEQGPAHAKEFVCNIKLGKFTTKGMGRSKKEAKRQAASTMLSQLRNLVVDGDVSSKVEEEEDDEEIPLTGESKFAYSALKDGKKKIPVLSPQQNKELQTFYKKTMKGCKTLQNKALNLPATNYRQMLQEIAEAQRFEVSYMDLPENNVSGKTQCLVQLSTMPVAVCHGTGDTLDDAHGHAAHNALQYLKIMTKS